MAQYIYLVLAILVLGVLGATVNRSVATDQTRQTLTETETLVTTVGTEMLDEVGRAWFDRYMFVNQAIKAEGCGRPTTAEKGKLAAYGAFVTTTRATVEGFHGLDTTVVRGGFDYRLHLRVRYVPDDRAKSAEEDTLTTQSFAKEVVLRVTNPYFEVGGQSLTLTMARTYTFGCPTNPAYVPRPGVGETCPSNPCARP